jgi:hypothetical protein
LGFQRYFERIEIRDEASQALHATLRIGNTCSPCLVVEREIPFPLEHAPAPYIFIPFEEFQTINPPAVPVRRRWLWF